MPHQPHANIDLSHLDDDKLVEACGKIKNGLTDNAADFTGLPISMAIYGGHLDDFSTILGKQVYPSKTGDLNTARTVLLTDTRENGVRVNQVAKGDLSLLEKSGYPISKPHAPVGPLAQASFKIIDSIPGGF